MSRGDITLWFSDEVIDSWEHENAEQRADHPFVYSDLAIETLLTLHELFRLPYRQTEGFGRALATLMNADVPIPDYTSLQKRAAKLGVFALASDRLNVAARRAPPRGRPGFATQSTQLEVSDAGRYVLLAWATLRLGSSR